MEGEGRRERDGRRKGIVHYHHFSPTQINCVTNTLGKMMTDLWLVVSGCDSLLLALHKRLILLLCPPAWTDGHTHSHSCLPLDTTISITVAAVER